MSERTLIVEFVAKTVDGPVDGKATVRLGKHPGSRQAVHDGTLSVIHPEQGEIGGYADGIWRRWWYEPETLS